LELKERLDHWVLKELKERLDHWVLKEHKGRLELKERLDHWVLKEHKELPDQVVHQELVVLVGRQVHQVLQDQAELQV
jgi:hypothetical protein